MSYKVIKVNQVSGLLENPKTVVLDMRDSNSYQAGCIERAIPVTEASLTQLIESAHPETPVLVYCYHGFSSRKLATMLVGQGFTEVHSLEGGWGAWSLQNR